MVDDADERPNVVLITVDSLRADHVHGPRADTPAMDDLATDGVAIDRAFAQGPFTTYSMPSLFTSRYPLQLPVIDFVEGVEGVLVGEAPTVATRLQEVGYTTAGIHSNPLLSELFGFDTGFEYFYDGLDSLAQRLPHRLGLLASKLRRILRRTAYVPAADITDLAIEWLENERGASTPFFLWVHYMDVHGPYESRHGPGFLEKFRSEWLWRRAVHSPETLSEADHDRLRRTYAEEVEYTDGEIGRLIRALTECGIYEDTVIALTADHGEEFAEHGSYSHHAKLFDELIHVPLTIKPSSDLTVTPSRASGLVPLLDIAPTLAAAGGAPTDGFEGRSLLGPLDGNGSDGRSVVSEASLPPEHVCSVRTVRWKLIDGPDGPALYDLETDPDESSDVSEEHPDRLVKLADRLDAHRAAYEQGSRRDEAIVSSGELDEQLRSLGYLK